MFKMYQLLLSLSESFCLGYVDLNTITNIGISLALHLLCFIRQILFHVLIYIGVCKEVTEKMTKKKRELNKSFGGSTMN